MRLVLAAAALAAQAAFAAPVSAQDDRLTYLADRIAIEDVWVRYATAHNTTDPSLYADVFTKDAQILSGGRVVLDGLDAILASVATDRERFNPEAEEGKTTYGTMRHIITNMTVEIHGETAKGSVYLLNTAFNDKTQKPEILAMGRYEDELVKTDGRWLISKRVMFVDWGNDELSEIVGVGPHTPAKYR